ncbi:predicted protein [Uncinocarpus reesii 1704]|uniref:Uncharacterized protein n=1 Tax=Uncinocarpus reesii (strain UAMH 1704) TaxID=336963 RepID=C4JKV8_UNCRE|nr:uncharacterized protein UREG_00191 [Uncinocarpus reesii 1704]EEP75345.1 predicted protein [Uncinocarpus reesii 1704]
MGTVEATTRQWPPFGSSIPGHVTLPRSRQDAQSLQDPTKLNHAPGESLPSIGFLDLGKSNKEHIHPSTTPPVSPSTAAYPTRPSHHTYASSLSTSTSPPSGSGYVYASNAHPLRQGERDLHPPLQQPHRQSLPSIHEALGSNPLPFQSSASSTTVAQSSASSQVTPTPGPDNTNGPTNPFAHTAQPPFAHDHFASQHSAKPASIRSEGQRSSVASVHSQESRNPSIMSLGSGKSPTQSSRTTHSQGSGYEVQSAPPTGSVPSPTAYGAYPPGYSYPPNGSQHNGAHPVAPYGFKGNAPWKPSPAENPGIEPATSSALVKGPPTPYSEPLKRQFDMFDLQATWNEIADGSNRTMEFSRAHATRIYQSNRTDQTLPPLTEIDDLLQIQRRNMDALGRIRHAVLDQEHALAQQRERMRVMQNEHGYSDDRAAYRDEYKGGGFAGGDAKKRRGV